MKYFVIATHWDDKRKAPVKYIAGEFDRYMNAVLFREPTTAVTAQTQRLLRLRLAECLKLLQSDGVKTPVMRQAGHKPWPRYRRTRK